MTTGAAQASSAQSPSAQSSSARTSSDIASLQAQVHNGTLLSSHGVRTMCASGCHADVVTTSPGSDTVLSTDTPVGLGATDLARAYSLPRASVGRKGTIAIISAGANTHLESDLATYRKQYGLPACTTASGCLTITDFHGGPPVEPGTTTEFKESEEESAVETSLDVDMASAACPDCHIMVVQTPDIDASGEPLPRRRRPTTPSRTRPRSGWAPTRSASATSSTSIPRRRTRVTTRPCAIPACRCSPRSATSAALTRPPRSAALTRPPRPGPSSTRATPGKRSCPGQSRSGARR